MAEAKEGKQHRVKKVGAGAIKKALKQKRKDGSAEAAKDSSAAAAKQRNPKAFVFKSRGRAGAARARTAEKDQRRMHGGLSELDCGY